MVVCVIALVVFAVLAVFSATYRPLAKEAFDCVFRKITFRPCRGNLDTRLKGQITGKIMKHNKKTGKWVYKYFEILSFIFMIIMIVSLVYAGYGMYNYVRYGNCNGAESREFCIFDAVLGPTFEESDVSVCSAPGEAEQQFHKVLVAPSTEGMLFSGNPDAPIELIEFGCYSCPYTRASQDLILKILNKFEGKIKFVFIHMPILTHENSMQAAIAAECAAKQGKFFTYHSKLFSESDIVLDESHFFTYAEDTGLDMDLFKECYDSNATKPIVEHELELGKIAGVYGTPTFFVNGRSVVGPQDYRAFKKIIEEELEK